MNKLIALILLIAVAHGAAATTASARSTNSVSGIVFYDLNRDGVQSPNERIVPNAEVNIQEVGGDVIESMIANEFGYFDTGEIAFGEYEVWTELEGQPSRKKTIQISEINGTALVDLGVAPIHNIMLPFISN